MIDRDKQIDYWIRGSNSDIETAELLFKGRKYIEGLFFCHLTIEKLIKALIVKNTGELAPKSHNLVYLAELAGTILSAEQNQFMSILMKYQLEGRYPEFHPKKPPKAKIDEIFSKYKIIDTMSQADVINILRSYLMILHDAGINIDQAYLYGSYARNQANDNSDIDVLLVSGIFDTDDDIILSMPWLYASKVDHRIEPLAVGKKRFMMDDISPVLEAVRQGGIEIRV